MKKIFRVVRLGAAGFCLGLSILLHWAGDILNSAYDYLMEV